MPAIRTHHIAATNVLPAYLVSLRLGLTESAIEAVNGWTHAHLTRPDAAVSGASTYAHMELMHGRPGFEDVLIQVARAHQLSSLGVVGLACKSVETVGQAMRCHQRYQHLTNRTARYESSVVDGCFVFTEHRLGSDRLGSLLISDLTMLIAVHLLRQAADVELPVLAWSSRRRLAGKERAKLEAFIGANVQDGAEHSSLTLDVSFAEVPVSTADPELDAYFQSVLASATPMENDAPALLVDVRLAIRDALVEGTPMGEQVARALGMGHRTLQRRLGEHGESFAKLLRSTRRQLAEGYLRDTNLSVAEVAYLLGYREQASFYRAFRRWNGVTPAAWRGECPPHRQCEVG